MKLIVLDEPSNYLDMILRDRMIELIQDVLKKTRSKLIMASHRMDEISAFSHSVIMLNKGTLAADVSMSLENRHVYAIRVDNSKKLREMIDKTTIEYEMKSTILGPTLIVLMSWNLWKILHRFTKEGGIIYGLNIVNEFEDKLGEFKL